MLTKFSWYDKIQNEDSLFVENFKILIVIEKRGCRVCKVKHVAIYIINRLIDYAAKQEYDIETMKEYISYSKVQHLVTICQLHSIKTLDNCLFQDDMIKSDNGIMYRIITMMFNDEIDLFKSEYDDKPTEKLSFFVKNKIKIANRLNLYDYEKVLVDDIFKKYKDYSADDLNLKINENGIFAKLKEDAIIAQNYLFSIKEYIPEF